MFIKKSPRLISFFFIQENSRSLQIPKNFNTQMCDHCENRISTNEKWENSILNPKLKMYKEYSNFFYVKKRLKLLINISKVNILTEAMVKCIQNILNRGFFLLYFCKNIQFYKNFNFFLLSKNKDRTGFFFKK